MEKAQRKGDIGAKQYADDHIQNLVGVGHTFRICVSNFSIYKKTPLFSTVCENRGIYTNTNSHSTYRQTLGYNKFILRQAPLSGDSLSAVAFLD